MTMRRFHRRRTVPALLCAAAVFSALHDVGAQLVSDGASAVRNGTATNLLPGNLTVGTNGNNTSLLLTNGAVVTSGSVFLGASGASSGNLITVSGPGSRITTDGGGSVFRIGNGPNSASNRLVISHGGTVSNGFGVIGFQAGSSNNSVLVTGAGSAWTNGTLYVGEGGSGNSLTIAAGGRVSAGVASIGLIAGASNNSVLVTGAGSLWTNSVIRVGDSGSGNSLTIADGGRVVATDIVRIGRLEGASNNWVNVTGTNSLLSVTNGINVGNGGGGALLSVNDGGSVIARNLLLGSNSTSGGNRLSVAGAGSSVTVTNPGGTGTLDVRRGAVEFNGGKITADRLLLTNTDGSFTFNSGTLVTRTATISNGLDFVVGAGGAVFNDATAISIPVGGPVSPYPSVIHVAGIGGTLTRVTVTLNDFSHTWPGDVDILLVGPDGQRVMLMSDAGGFNPGVFNSTLTFDDGAAQPPSAGVGPATGTYLPVDYEPGDFFPAPAPPGPYATSLAAFNGGNPNGAWSLHVEDDFPGADGGSIAGWSLTLVTTAAATWDVRSNAVPTTVADGLIIGADAANSTLLVTNGATLAVAGTSLIGLNTGSTNNRVVISGPGSRWTNGGFLYVGASGSGNTLVVSNGGMVASGLGFIGDQSGASNNTAVITGAGSRWNTAGFLSVGANNSGAGNSLLVSSGGTVDNAGTGYIGFASSGGAATVTGSGSRWTNSDELRVGESGSANSLLIAAGGTVANTDGRIGMNFGADGNAVIVTGAGSLWTNGGALRVGESGSGNSLLIASGGAVHAASTVVGANPGAIGNILRLDNGTLTTPGGLTVNADNTLAGNGTINGSVTGAGLITPGNSAGTLQINGSLSLAATAGVHFEIGGLTPGTQHDRIQVTSFVQFAGTLSLELINGFTPGSGDSFTLMTFASATGTFGNAGQLGVVNTVDETYRFTLSYNGTSLVAGNAQALAPQLQTAATLPNLKLSTAGEVYAMVVQPDGKIIVGGRFFLVNNSPRNNLARLNPNGTLDETWNPPSPNFQVVSMVLVGTDLYIAGEFLTVGGVVRPHLAKLTTTGAGALDTSWNPGLAHLNDTGLRYRIARKGPHLYVAGGFTSIGGQPRAGLARVNLADAAVDPSWNPAPDGDVKAFLVHSDELFLGGAFNTIGGMPRRGVAKFLSSGAMDAGWDAQIQSGFVNALEARSTNLFMGGVFTGVGGTATLTNAAKVRTTGAGALASPLWTPNPDGPVTALNIVNLRIYMGGNFSVVAGQPRRGLAKLNTSGAGVLEADWKPVPSFNTEFEPTFGTFDRSFIGALVTTGSDILACGNFRAVDGAVAMGIARLVQETGARDALFPASFQIPGKVHAIARQEDGRLILGGEFGFAGGLPRQNLARMNPDGTLDTTWAPPVGDTVTALALDGTNLFAGGFFTNVGALQRNFLAKIATVNSDAVDTNWNGGAAGAAGFFPGVLALALDGTNLFVGGSFTTLGGAARNNIAKLATTGAGAADPVWNPGANGQIGALALSGTDLFAGGSFTSLGGFGINRLAKLSTLGAGTVDAAWNPAPGGVVAGYGPRVTSLLHDGTELFVGGVFNSIGGQSRQCVAKLAVAGTGAADPLWNPVPATGANNFCNVRSLALLGPHLYFSGDYFYLGHLGPYFGGAARAERAGGGAVDFDWNLTSTWSYIWSGAMLASGNGLHLGGRIQTYEGADYNSFIHLSAPGAPVLYQDTATNFFIARHPDDGPEVTHYRVVGIAGGALTRPGGAPVQVNEFITVAEGAAGLNFVTGGTVTVVSSLNSTPSGTGSAASTLTLVASPAPSLAFSAPAYSIREGQGNLTVIVRKFGTGTASVTFATSNLTAAAGSDYAGVTNTLNFSAMEKQKNILIAIADDLAVEDDEQFAARLSNPVGAPIIGPSTVQVRLRDNDGAGSQTVPGQSPLVGLSPAGGVLAINLDPPAAGGQWRLLGALDWKNGGESVSGLLTGNYQVEFRPVSGYFPPSATPVTLPVTAGITNTGTFVYVAVPNPDMGDLAVLIGPGDVATNANPVMRGQWRQQGTVTWLDSGMVVSNLGPGAYTVEFKAVPGRITPAPRVIEVGANATYSTAATYLFEALPGAQTPSVVGYPNSATNGLYQFNGQVQTDSGFGSGFVVKRRVVLTAAHVLFDDVQLSFVVNVRWFFQRYRDQLEPVPMTPRGWYVFEGYAAQRAVDNSPGLSGPDSQNMDAAAMYFLEDAGRGGFGGFVSSDADNNEFLLGAADKFLAGYPLNGITATNQGKLHATTPANLGFTRLYNSVFATADIQGFPGNSGGPLSVQTGPNEHLPAAIYLGGSGQTIVRAINSEVVELIDRAETSGNGGGNNTGGGVTLLSSTLNAGAFSPGLLTVNLNNTAGGWRLMQGTNASFITNATATVALFGGGSFNIEFKPLAGHVAPSNRTVSVAVGGQVTVNGSYLVIPPVELWRAANFGVNAANMNIAGPGANPDGDGLVNQLEYALGTDPNIPNPQPFPLSLLTNVGGTSYLALRFTRPTNNTDITYAVLVASNLNQWHTGSTYSATTSIGTNAHTTQVSRNGAPVETIVVRDNTPVNGPGVTNRFIRLQVLGQ